MSENDLFPEAHSLSPKLKWLAKHGLKTIKEKPPRAKIPEEPWRCTNGIGDGFKDGFGDTEESACIDYSFKNRIKHWSLE